jgi:phosphoribosylformylglycinamidine synthase
MAAPKVLILTGYGINCDFESLEAFRRAGARPERVHVNDLIDGHYRLADYQILVFPGGFSYGDDIASGKALASKVHTYLGNDLGKFVQSDKLVIGICNGFQVMTRLGLAPDFAGDHRKQECTLTYNDSARYEDRWINLVRASDNCVFTRGIDQLYVPVAHGEGKFFSTPDILDKLEKGGQVVFRYAMPDGTPARGVYPHNPNGSLRDIAGVCDKTGRVFGMMPHPERFLEFTNHPQWTAIRDRLEREGRPLPSEGNGQKIFRNAVDYFR